MSTQLGVSSRILRKGVRHYASKGKLRTLSKSKLYANCSHTLIFFCLATLAPGQKLQGYKVQQVSFSSGESTNVFCKESCVLTFDQNRFVKYLNWN